jgi:uncharacterized membrane protein
MQFVFEFTATICAGLFSGAALYITLVEHPARMECGTVLAATVFGPSYRRAAVMQALLAAISFVAAVGAWLKSSALVSTLTWLLGGALIVAVIPFTLIVILPTNKKLLDPSLDRSSETARQLLTRWGRLHAVRTVLGVAAFAVFLLGIIPGSRVDAPWRPSGDSILGAKEAVLKQDLFQMRSLISQYTLDKQRAPKSLDDLVSAGYIKKIPADPMTGKPDWQLDQEEIIDPKEHKPGTPNVHSLSSQISSNGTAYSTW